MPKWNLKAPISGMRVGDSFFVPCLACEQLESRIRSIAADFGYKVSVRSTTEDLIKGIRTWRIS